MQPQKARAGEAQVTGASAAKVLCVEDEPDIRADIAEELLQSGYEVLQAENGRRGLELILQHRPDLVISDASMPQMTGYDLLAELRENHDRLANMPFILLSAFAGRDEIIGGMRLGADDYLTKPIDFEMLLAKVDAAIRRARRVQCLIDGDRARVQRALTNARPMYLRNKNLVDNGYGLTPLNFALVGTTVDEMGQLKRLLEDGSNTVTVFTSGRAYLDGAPSLQAPVTFLWPQSDDLPPTDIAAMRAGSDDLAVLVCPPDRGGDFVPPTGIDFTLKPPVSARELFEKIRGWSRSKFGAADCYV